MDERVKPCPWCGEYPKIAEDGGSAGPWFCVWHDCPPVEGGKARHYGESLGCISISTAWFHTEAEAIAAWNTRAELGSGTCEYKPMWNDDDLLTGEYVGMWYTGCGDALVWNADNDECCKPPAFCPYCGGAVKAVSA